jgi:hypothetical protein
MAEFMVQEPTVYRIIGGNNNRLAVTTMIYLRW